MLVLRALRHESHWVEVLGGPDMDALIRELVDEDWRAGGRDGNADWRVFAHALPRGDTGEPFESIEYDWREHGDAIRGEDDGQPWNAAKPLSCAETRVEVCLAEARYVEEGLRGRLADLRQAHSLRPRRVVGPSGAGRVSDGPVP